MGCRTVPPTIAQLAPLLTLALAFASGCGDEALCSSWVQWGANAAHLGQVCAKGQRLERALSEVVVDPFVEQEVADADGDILVHYQAPLVSGPDVFMEVKRGTYTPCIQPIPPDTTATCAPDRWNSEIRTLVRYTWDGGELASKWSFVSDWKPPPTGGFQPAFQPALCGDTVWIPGAEGSVYEIERVTGAKVRQVRPTYRDTADGSKVTYVAGPITASADCTVHYTAVQLDRADPWGLDAKGWLVAISPAGRVSTVDFDTLTAGIAPKADHACVGVFRRSETPRPWPPPPGADGSTTLPDTHPCLSQRPAIGAAPAIGPDGTIFVVSRAHGRDRYSYVVAVRPDLTTKWVASLRDHLHDGCGGFIPTDGDPVDRPFACRPGAMNGVDPSTNQLPAGRAVDDSSSSPVALPDGGVLFGAYTGYNNARGHLFAFDANGAFTGSYPFGWDTTPAIYAHDGTYSIIMKDNVYGEDENGIDLGPFFIVQLDPRLELEWRFQSTNTKRCRRGADDALECVDDHPNGFEWCVNAAAIDADGTVYVNSEDGNVYAILQGGIERDHLFLEMAIGAAYTPLALGGDGRIYTLNDGRMIAVGE